MRKKISIVLKFLIGIFALLGITIACVFAVRDGYTHWYKRLFYFTQQSNIWIGVTCLVLAILSVIELREGKVLVKDYMHVIKFMFTVSIALTGLIFCSLLGPFADESYNAWSFSSILTHVVVPLLSISDFFVDDVNYIFKKSHVFLALIPPFAYFVFASILTFCKVDFGMGEMYPYFFMNYYSEAGVFGFVDGVRPEIGVFYWLSTILLIILGMAFLFYAIHPATRKNRKIIKQENKKREI